MSRGQNRDWGTGVLFSLLIAILVATGVAVILDSKGHDTWYSCSLTPQGWSCTQIPAPTTPTTLTYT